jgi:hypothetical protein
MFAGRYFAGRYFPPRYFPEHGAAMGAPTPETLLVALWISATALAAGLDSAVVLGGELRRSTPLGAGWKGP